jgi:hypothetical protein
MVAGGALLMIARVDGKVVVAEALRWPAMNFDQFRWNYPLGGYELELPRAAFFDRLGAAYRQCAAELRADDALVPAQSPSPLRDTGYPPLADLPDHPAALFEAVQVYPWEDLFAASLPCPPGAGRFMINSVDAVSASAAVVVVVGRGYHAGAGL